MKCEDIASEVLDSLRSKVRVGLLWDISLTIALSPESGKWGKTIKAKILSDQEVEALIVILTEAREVARKNEAARKRQEAKKIAATTTPERR